MASLPSAADVRAELENYVGVDSSLVTDTWIINRLTKSIIPWVEKKIRVPIAASSAQITEFLSGTGTSLLILSHKPVLSIDAMVFVSAVNTPNLSLSYITYDSAEGFIKAKGVADELGGSGYMFPRGSKNIKVTYTYGLGTLPDDLQQALIYLAAEAVLGHIEGMTGGGTPTANSFSKAYGNRGKYTNIRNDLARMAISILKSYWTGVVGH